jgi:hypothetical protein
MRLLYINLSFILFKTTTIRFNYNVFSSNKHALIIEKQTRTRILIKRIIIIIRNITIRKIKNIILIIESQRRKTTTMSKSFFSRFLSYFLETQNASNAI